MLRYRIILLIFVVSGFIFGANAELRLNPNLGHYLSIEEMNTEISRDFYPTDPPEEARNIAEFEPMEGVLIRYPFGISYSLIAEFSEDDKVVTIVASNSQQNSVISSYNSHGVNLDNCEFLIAASDSYWTRDYGPWYIYDGEEVAIVNFDYNRPRPNDNDIPIEVADFLGINLYGMSVEHTGGNYMTDGCGISASSDLVLYENPGLSAAQINQYMEDFLGITTYHTLPDPNNTYIDHIDCWGKFLAVDKVLIREVPASHAQYDELEATADYFAEQICAWGYPYEVYRVYTPYNQPYSNSLILNKKVYVPITGSSWDDDALEVYESALPGYEVLGFTGSWESTDALHCRTKGIADRDMVHIAHNPYWEEQDGGNELTFSAEITPYSGAEVFADSIYLAWKIDNGNWNYSQLDFLEDNLWQANLSLPPSNSSLEYYLHAEDVDGNEIDHPLTAEYDPHNFDIHFNNMMFGDIDGNLIVESFDAALILQYVVGFDPIPQIDPLPWEEDRLEISDVDNSGMIDAYDASVIMQYIVGIIDELPLN